MTQHRSLKRSMSTTRHRNVLKRFERIKKLKEDERWDEGTDSIYGLPKVRSIKLKAKSRKEPDKTEEGEGAAGA